MFRSIALLFLLLCSVSTFAASRIVLVFGDSLSAGFGLGSGESWPALLGQRLQHSGSGYAVANLSISGETTAGGRARIDEALKRLRPRVVILALGANDGLRGLPVKQMRDNLDAIAAASRRSGARLLVAGMKLPPNYGPAYTRDFEAAFAAVATAHQAALLPFLLEPIALDRAAFQADGLHPVAAAQPRILDHVWGSLKPLLD